jgi:hypothetical protein
VLELFAWGSPWIRSSWVARITGVSLQSAIFWGLLNPQDGESVWMHTGQQPQPWAGWSPECSWKWASLLQVPRWVQGGGWNAHWDFWSPQETNSQQFHRHGFQGLQGHVHSHENATSSGHKDRYRWGCHESKLRCA